MTLTTPVKRVWGFSENVKMESGMTLANDVALPI